MVNLINIAANYSLKSWPYAVTQCQVTGQYLSQWMTRNAAQIWIRYHLSVYMALIIIMHVHIIGLFLINFYAESFRVFQIVLTGSLRFIE